jgi:molybdopterin/thiamine biosynthesis adenylyltransferase
VWEASNDARTSAAAIQASVSLRGVPAGAAATAGATAAVFGLGAVGGPCFEALARFGVGTLYGVDPDRLDGASFLTQATLWREAGRFKADVFGRRAARINPLVRVRTAVGLAQSVPLGLLRAAEVWVAAGDNRELPAWLGRMAARLGKVVIQGAVDPESLAAIVRVFDLRDANAPCPGCRFTSSEWGSLRAVEGCAGLPEGESTRALPTVCGMAAAMAATEAIKRLVGLADVALSGEEYVHSLLTHRGYRTKYERNAECRSPHDRWAQQDVATGADRTTLGMLAATLGIGGPSWEVQASGERPWLSFALCDGCGGATPVRRFVAPGTSVGECTCGARLAASPQGCYRTIPFNDALEVWDRPLAGLGVEPGGAVSLTRGDEGHYFFLPGMPQGWDTPDSPTERGHAIEP